MYEKLIRQPATAKHEQPFNIRLNPIPLHDKVGYIDSVCAVLIESRFGRGRSRRIILDLREQPGREPAVFCDMTLEGRIPSYIILPDSEMARRCRGPRVSKDVTHNLRNHAKCVKTVFPAKLGVKPLLTRGPPQHPGTHI